MAKKKGILLGSLAVFALVLIYVLYRFNYLPHPKYSNEKFGIETYRSQVDRDGDGVDDQTDILQSVRAYLDTRPKYKSRYYATGYPDDGVWGMHGRGGLRAAGGRVRPNGAAA